MKVAGVLEYWLMAYAGICPPDVYSRHKSEEAAEKAKQKAEKKSPGRKFLITEVKWV